MLMLTPSGYWQRTAARGLPVSLIAVVATAPAPALIAHACKPTVMPDFSASAAANDRR
jgi:hypothetical protein